MKGAFGIPILKESGITDRTVGKSDVGFLYAPQCDRCAISNHSVTMGYRGGSPTAFQAWRTCPLCEPSPSHPILL